MKAVVLAGGLGTRLRPLTLTTPKQMLPVVDRPMIEHVLAGLARAGVDGAVLSLGYRPEAFQAAYPGGVCAGVALSYAVEPQPLGTAGAIRFAAAAAGLDETFLAVNGDVISDLDVGRLQDRHRRWGAEATIQLVEVDDPSRYGLVVADDDGRVRSFTEKPSAAETPVAGEAPVAGERPGTTAPTVVAEKPSAAEPPGGAERLGPARASWVNAGMYVLEPSVLDRIDAGRPVPIERDTFPELAAAGTLRAVDGAGYWIDIGTPQSYLAAQLDLIDGTRGPALPGVAASADVDSGAAVERSVVMAGARVGPGAVVRNAAIQAGASVEPGAVVTDSVIGPGAIVGARARVTGGSVVGPGAAVEPGASLSGTRTPDDRPEDG